MTQGTSIEKLDFLIGKKIKDEKLGVLIEILGLSNDIPSFLIENLVFQKYVTSGFCRSVGTVFLKLFHLNPVFPNTKKPSFLD